MLVFKSFSTNRYILLQTVSHNYHGSNVYSVLLDATKAFDRVHYCKLFKELVKRKLSHTFKRFDMECFIHDS